MAILDKNLIVGTNNEDKLKEIIKIIAPWNLNIYTPKALNIESPHEHGNSFLENAEIKARYYMEKSGVSALAEDSGLCVEILQGKPGIHTADWAREVGNISEFFQVILKQIKNINPKIKSPKATFKVAFVYIDFITKNVKSVETQLDGSLSFKMLGNNGFGFDAFFIPEGQNKTLAEMSDAKKNDISPRKEALQKLLAF